MGKIGVARPAGLGRHAQPVNRRSRLTKQRVGRRDVVGRVVEVDVARSPGGCRVDIGLRAFCFRGLGKQNGPRTRNQSAWIFGMGMEVVFDERPRLLVPGSPIAAASIAHGRLR